MEFGVNLYDSQARFQSNIGAFLSKDPLAEKYYGISPYSYCAGNPVNLVDPEGDIIHVAEEDQELILSSHELYGHAFIYIESGYNHTKASHKTVNSVDMNYYLCDKIKRAQKETIQNLFNK